MKRILPVLLVAALVLLAACGGSAQVPETQPADTAHSAPQTTAAAPPTEPQPSAHEFPALGFSLTFPGSWQGRFSIRQEQDAVTVIIDETPTFSIASAVNDADSRGKQAELIGRGYDFYCEGLAYTYYLRIMADIPPELSRQGNGAIGNLSFTENDIDFAFCAAAAPELGEAYWGALNRGLQLCPADTDYTNERLGISLRLPEQWRGRYHLIATQQTLSVFPMREELREPATFYFYILAYTSESGLQWEQLLPEMQLLAQTDDVSYYLMLCAQGTVERENEFFPLLAEVDFEFVQSIFTAKH